MNSAMLVVVFVLLLVHVSSGSFTARCSNDTSEDGIRFEAVSGRFPGRYAAQVCGAVDPRVTEWQLTVSYYERLHRCKPRAAMIMRVAGSKQHSNNVEWTNFTNTCTHVCLTTQFDLIFSSCYYLRSTFWITSEESKHQWNSSIEFFNITNSYTIESIKSNRASVEVVNHKNDTTVIWHTGVPTTDYEVLLCNNTDSHEECHVRVRTCQLMDAVTIACRLALRCFGLKLRHSAPWITGTLYPQAEVHYPYNCSEWSGAEVEGGGAGGGRWWRGAGGAALVGAALVLAAAGALLACRSHRAHTLRKHVLRRWVQLTNTSSVSESDAGVEGDVGDEGGRGAYNVLVVYAREEQRGQRFIDALRELLQDCTTGQVLDLYSPGVASLGGAGLRAALVAERTRVVLVQSPAMHCLYGTHIDDTQQPPALAAPLLGAGAVRRAPLYGDQQLHLALALIRAAPHHAHYDKYYVAEISSLRTEVVGAVVPYRRYALPAGAALLATHAAGARRPPAPHLVQQCTDTLREFVQHVQENPDYLLDELVPV